MYMGSDAVTEAGGSSTNSSTESLNGLKFGQKIYFEDAGAGSGAPAKSGPGSSTGSPGSSSGSGRKGRGGGVVQGSQPPRCQVEGCKVDLSDAKAYYSRHKVCGMHSKSSKVIVGGLEQRFCQQCSRFHQLPEFDQGKRSCRRRLAGHNERRRKPPPGSLLSSRFGRLSSSMFENSSRGGSFVMDFSAYPRLAGRDAWPTTRSSENEPGSQTTAMGRPLAFPWQNNAENPLSDLFLQGPAGGISFSSPEILPGEYFTGVANSSCALSLLSNQSWGSRQASGLGVNDLMNAEVAPVSQPAASHGAAGNHYPNTSWGLKGNEAGSSSDDTSPALGLGQISQPANSQFSGGLEWSQQNRKHYMELEHSRAYDSTQHMNWSL